MLHNEESYYHNSKLLATDFFATAYQCIQTTGGRNVVQKVQQRHVDRVTAENDPKRCIEDLFSS